MASEQSYQYVPQLPHSGKWCMGFSLSNNCDTYREIMRKQLGRLSGPKDGMKIRMQGIPTSHTTKPVYLRFWASRGGRDSSQSFKVAYDIEEDDTEAMPPSNYPNGGMVKVDREGVARFSLHLPSPYSYNDPVNGEPMVIPSHFHYRLCYGKKMSPVQTQFLD